MLYNYFMLKYCNSTTPELQLIIKNHIDYYKIKLMENGR